MDVSEPGGGGDVGFRDGGGADEEEDVILSPESSLENRPAAVPKILGTSGTLMLFYPVLNGPTLYPPVTRAWGEVAFPLPRGNEGSLDFTVPGGVGKRCVFVGALVPFPVESYCEVSNGFNLP